MAPRLSLLDSALVVVCRSTFAATLGVVVGVGVEVTTAAAATAEEVAETIGVVGSVMEAMEHVEAGGGVESTVMTGAELAICTTAGEWVVGTRVTVVEAVEDWAGVVLLLMMVCCSTVAC